MWTPPGPTSCEEERRAATAAANLYVPSCERDGAYTSRQCQQGVQCWCVDATGREIPGTRQLGDSLVCSKFSGNFFLRSIPVTWLCFYHARLFKPNLPSLPLAYSSSCPSFPLLSPLVLSLPFFPSFYDHPTPPLIFPSFLSPLAPSIFYAPLHNLLFFSPAVLPQVPTKIVSLDDVWLCHSSSLVLWLLRRLSPLLLQPLVCLSFGPYSPFCLHRRTQPPICPSCSRSSMVSSLQLVKLLRL